MFIAATLSLLTTLAPQAPAATSQEAKPLLSEREQKSLGDKLQKHLVAEITYENSEGSARAKASKKNRSAKEAFEKDWDKAEEKGVLGSVVDLRAIFHNCFETRRPDVGKGNFYMRDVKGTDQKYGIHIPKKYSEKDPWTTIVVLPSGKAGDWNKPSDHFMKTWGSTEALGDMIVHLPMIPAGLEMDPIPDYNRDGAEDDEKRRISSVFESLRVVMTNYTVDRARMFLDCGTESCGFGLRLATFFPDRFAGIILRDAVEIADLRIGNLLHVPILALKTGNNAATLEKMKKRWDESCPGMMTILDAKGEAPHLESAGEIAAWMADKRRNMTPTKVTLEPNHDSFHKTYWVGMLVADPLLTSAPDKKPRLQVVADRATNRITVDAQGVDRFELLLNDELVDLDKEFTVIINGKATKETRRRSFGDMKRRMMGRSDWEYLFPVRHTATVPKD
jgi:hypothetical protein